MNSDKNCRSGEGGHGGEVVKQEFHILAVDDSLIDRKLLERLLTISSYQVTCVESGDKALEYLGLEMDSNNENIIPQQKEIDEYGTSDSSSSSSSIIPQPNQEQVSKVVVNMIMTDYSMPGISGYELLKRVKDSSWKDIPVVVMSSEDIPSRINKCLESGAEEFLLKPVKLSDLSNLHSHLQTKSASNGTLSPNNSSCDETTNGEDNTNSILSTTTIPNTVEVSKCNGTTSSSSSILHSNKRKATSTAKLTSSSGAAALSEMMPTLPRVTELPVS